MTWTIVGTFIIGWLLTYWLHSTLFIGSAAVIGCAARTAAWKDALWKLALVGGLFTATIQSATGFKPSLGRLSVDVEAPPPGRSTGVAVLTNRDAGSVAISEEIGAAFDPSAKTSAEAATGAASLNRRTPGSDNPPQVAETRRPAPVTALLAGWIALAVLLLARQGYRHLRIRRLLADRRSVIDGALLAMFAELRRNSGIWHPVAFTTSPSCPTPLALGASEICVPDRFLTELGSEEQRAALAHELAHIARHDPFWLLVAGAISALFSFQPLNHVARIRMREAAEFICDDWAVHHTGSELGLARCLATVAGWVTPGADPILSSSMAMAEGGSPLLVRVNRLLDHKRETVSQSRLARTLAVALLFVMVVAAAPAIVTSSRDADGSGAGAGNGSGRGVAEVQQDVIVIRAPNPAAPLSARWSWAHAEAARRGDSRYWVMYAVGGMAAVGSESARVLRGSLRAPSAPLITALGIQGDVSDALREGPGAIVVMFLIEGQSAGQRWHQVHAVSAWSSWNAEQPVYWLGSARGTESVAWLREMSEHTDSVRARRELVEAIGMHSERSVVGYLTRIATTSPSEDLRRGAVTALAFHPTDENFKLLQRIVRSDNSKGVRREAVESIGKSRHPNAIDALRAVIASDGPPEIRRQAAESLGEQNGSSVSAQLQMIATSDPDPVVRRQAAESLQELEPADAVPALVRLIWDNDETGVQIEAAEALGEVGTTAAVSALDSIVRHHPSVKVAVKAVEAIGGVGTVAAVNLLAKIARVHGNASVRHKAAEELGDIGRR